MIQQNNLSNDSINQESLTIEEQVELKTLLSELKDSGHTIQNLAKMLKEHNHDNQNSVYVKTLNIDDSAGKVINIDSEKVSFGLGVRLKNNADGLANLGDGDLGTIFYNTTYHEVWVWRYNGVDGNEWKALSYVA